MLCSRLLDALLWLFTVPAALATLVSIKGGRRFLEYVSRRVRTPLEPPAGGWPAVALIVPVRGAEPGLAQHLRALRDQDYPGMSLVVCFADARDSAVAVARSAVGHDARFVEAGPPPPDIGEKVHNLIAAVDAVGASAQILVFADSDGLVPPDWVRKLVAALHAPRVAASTAFRWHFPERGGFWPLLRSVWDSAVLTTMDTRDMSFAWGGGTAVWRESFDAAGVREHWKGAVSDDLRLTRALHAAGMGIRFAPEALVATLGSCGRAQFLAWAVRQATITRVYRFRMWAAGFAGHSLYCGTQLLSLLYLAQGNLAGLFPLALVTLPGMVKGSTRAYACSLALPESQEWFDRYGWAHFWMSPLATWVWLYAFVRSGLTRRIRWRGRTYVLLSEDRVREVRTPQARVPDTH